MDDYHDKHCQLLPCSALFEVILVDNVGAATSAGGSLLTIFADTIFLFILPAIASDCAEVLEG